MTFKTFLFFGGADFIGINFIKNILKSNGSIIVYDKLINASNAKETLSMLSNNKIIFINDEICNTL